MDKVQKIREAVKKRYECWKEKEFNSHSIESETRMSECKHLLLMLDSLQEEPVSEDLEEACEQLAENARKHKAETSSPFFSQTDYKQGVMDGAKWQKEHQQAEKYLALTWEDMRELYIIFAEVDTEIELCKTDIKSETIGYYQEVLKRFKNLKK